MKSVHLTREGRGGYHLSSCDTVKPAYPGPVDNRVDNLLILILINCDFNLFLSYKIQLGLGTSWKTNLDRALPLQT